MALVQSASGNGGAPFVTSYSVTFGAAITPGNGVLVSVAAYNNNLSSASVTDDKGNTYIIHDSIYDSASGNGICVAISLNITNGAKTITVTVTSGTMEYPTLVVCEFSDLVALDQHSSHLNSSATNLAVSPSVTTTSNNELCFGYGVIDNGTFTTIGSGWIDIAGPNAFYVAGYQVQATAGAIQATFNQSTSGTSGIGIITFTQTGGGTLVTSDIPAAFEFAVISRMDTPRQTEFLAGARGDRMAPVEFAAIARMDGLRPVEWVALQQADRPTQVESLGSGGGSMVADALIQVEFLLSLDNPSIQVEWLGAAVADAHGPIEASGRSEIATLPIEWGASLRTDRPAQLESTGTTGTSVTEDSFLPLEFLTAARGDRGGTVESLGGVRRDAVALAEWQGAVLVTADLFAPVEFLVIGRGEAGLAGEIGSLLLRNAPAPNEWLAGAGATVLADSGLPIELWTVPLRIVSLERILASPGRVRLLRRI